MKNFNGKTILVTGASGLIGSNLIFHFIKNLDEYNNDQYFASEDK